MNESHGVRRGVIVPFGELINRELKEQTDARATKTITEGWTQAALAVDGMVRFQGRIVNLKPSGAGLVAVNHGRVVGYLAKKETETTGTNYEGSIFDKTVLITPGNCRGVQRILTRAN